MMRKYNKSTFLQISEVSRVVSESNTFTAKGFSETSPLVHLIKHMFGSQQLQKYLTYEAHFFSKHSTFPVDNKKLKKK